MLTGSQDGTTTGQRPNNTSAFRKRNSLSAADLALFARIGIPEDLLVRAGIDRATDQEARDHYGICGSGDMSGIVYSYFDPHNGQRRTARLRRDNPEIEAGQPKRKYVSAYGDRRHLYFPPDSKELLADPTVPIILVEAEKSALALTAFAQRTERKCLPVAMGGCWGWRGRIGKVEGATGERVDEMGPLPDLACASNGREVIVLLDSNANSNSNVQRARRALHIQLSRQGAKVSIAELPGTEGINGPDDYIGAFGDTAMATVLDAVGTKHDAGHTLRDPMRGQMIAKGQAQSLLLELADDIEFFHTSDRDAFASVRIGDHLETYPIASRDFALVLLHRFYSLTSSAPPKQAMESVLGVFTSRALFDGVEQQAFLRVGQLDGSIYLDLGDPSWSAVEISAAAWRVVPNPPVRFWRSRGMRALPHPVAGGDINELRSFLNIADQEWPLVLAWILAAYRPRGPFPILTLNGEQGSCKSSASAVLRNLVDPNAATLRSGPRDERDLFIAANNSLVITLDNLSHLPNWLSDALCRLATGGGMATRQLYSDLNETIFNVQRPVILNGIADVVTRGDLLDRSIVVSLPPLDPAKRRDEAEFQSDFECKKPRLFGALLSALATALAHLPKVKLARKPRMADFALFGVAVERGLEWPVGTFINAYEANRGIANSSVLEASPIALAILALVDDRSAFEGTASELLSDLPRYADEQATRHRSWPDSAWRLSNLVCRLAPSLRASGVEVTKDRRSDRNRTRIIKIGRSASAVSYASTITENRPIMRTFSDERMGPADGTSQPCTRSNSSIACVADASNALDAPVLSAMIRGEI